MYSEHMQTVGYNTNNKLAIDPYTASTLQTSTSATLFLFSPKESVNEARRSHQYHFNEEAFCQSLYDSLNKQALNPLDTIKSSYMLDNAAAHLAILPSAYPQMINTSPLGQMWTFILVVDNDPFGISNGYFKSPIMKQNRVLYSGICLEEPCNPLAVDGHTSVNLNAYLQVTHQTYAEINKSVNMTGYEQISKVTHNRDIVAPNLVKPTDSSNEADVLLDPAHMRTSYHPTDMGYQFAPIDAKLQNYDMTPVILETEMNVPRKHLQTLLHPFFVNVQQLEEMPLISDKVSMHSHMPTIADVDSIKESFDNSTLQAYRMHSVPLSTGFNPIELKSIQDLLNIYPNMKIQPLKIPYSLPVDALNPLEVTETNTATSIITSSVPAYLTSHGLSHAVFSYISAVPSLINNGGPMYDVKVHDIGTIVPESPEITHKRWNSFLKLLQSHVFETIRQVVGEFEVNISVQSAGSCFVQLHLLDFYRQNNSGYTVTNSYYGSINTPMIGSEAILENNVNQFASLIPQITNLITKY